MGWWAAFLSWRREMRDRSPARRKRDRWVEWIVLVPTIVAGTALFPHIFEAEGIESPASLILGVVVAALVSTRVHLFGLWFLQRVKPL